MRAFFKKEKPKQNKCMTKTNATDPAVYKSVQWSLTQISDISSELLKKKRVIDTNI